MNYNAKLVFLLLCSMLAACSNASQKYDDLSAIDLLKNKHHGIHRKNVELLQNDIKETKQDIRYYRNQIIKLKFQSLQLNQELLKLKKEIKLVEQGRKDVNELIPHFEEVVTLIDAMKLPESMSESTFNILKSKYAIFDPSLGFPDYVTQLEEIKRKRSIIRGTLSAGKKIVGGKIRSYVICRFGPLPCLAANIYDLGKAVISFGKAIWNFFN